MASQEFTSKIKQQPTPENKTKILDVLEEQFGAIGTCDRDDDEIKVSKIKTFFNFFDAKASIELKEKGDAFALRVLLDSKPSTSFWIQVGISALLVFVGFGLILFLVDAVFYFLGKKKLNESVNETLSKVQNEF